MEATTLKISNALNKLGDNYRIGNLLNKNLLIRNLALMRNIGKYSLYSEPMFPEVGMVYNIYERLLNRPEDIGMINGLIGLNNAITDDVVLKGDGDKSENRFVSVDFKPEGSDSTSVEKIVYVTNSDNVTRKGGDEALGVVMKIVNKHLLPENKYLPDSIYSGVGMSINTPTFYRTKNSNLYKINTYGTYSDDNEFYLTYREGEYDSDKVEAQKNTASNQVITYMPAEFDKEDYSATNNNAASLIKKTNALFKAGKINSLISRFYAEDNGEFLSRGRNLKKEGATNQGGGYDNPYCRVWTIHHQYNRMTDLIRPRMNDENFADIKEIQAKYGEGLRPADGASRLSDMSVLKSNGFVNITPKRNGDKIDKESIKRCMFSIENLAWKDVMLEGSVVRKTYARDEDGNLKYDKDGNLEYVNEDASKVVGGTLTAEQQGPNGGRIMWFPPYNLKFSEDVVTNWNSNTFIGRGENMYTYVNTERSGSLSFTLLIDHPSIVDKWTYSNPSQKTYEDEQKILRFFAGCDDLGDESRDVNNIFDNKTETVNGTLTPKEAPTQRGIKVFIFFPNDYSGVDEKSSDAFLDYMYDGEGNNGSVAYEQGKTGTQLTNPIPVKDYDGKYWNYKVDNSLVGERLDDNNYTDASGFSLNSLSDIDQGTKTKLLHAGFIKNNEQYWNDYFSFRDLCDSLEKQSDVKTGDSWLDVLLNTEQIRNIEKVELRGYASSHGHLQNNQGLSKHRAETIMKLIQDKKPGISKDKFVITTKKVIGLDANNKNVSSLDAKLARSVEVVFYVSQNKEVTAKTTTTSTKTNNNGTYSNSEPKTAITYDDEYMYFKEVSENDSFIRNRITEKVKYFDPAFHSITPEGFNARLTFLQQCTRQGPTVSASDNNNNNGYTGVGNLAFGRAPYCVLRIGDFYNTKILIESMSINYDTAGGTQWDLNPEGVGVQPMMAEVQIRFKFIGGTDISGPIERLQNAVSFNYYSNASIYDRRADYRGAMIERGEKDGANPVYFFDARTQGKDNK